MLNIEGVVRIQGISNHFTLFDLDRGGMAFIKPDTFPNLYVCLKRLEAEGKIRQSGPE